MLFCHQMRIYLTNDVAAFVRPHIPAKNRLAAAIVLVRTLRANAPFSHNLHASLNYRLAGVRDLQTDAISILRPRIGYLGPVRLSVFAIGGSPCLALVDEHAALSINHSCQPDPILDARDAPGVKWCLKREGEPRRNHT